jgi:hypothetical protein
VYVIGSCSRASRIFAEIAPYQRRSQRTFRLLGIGMIEENIMKTIKTALLVGALTIASSGAFAQTIAPNVGVDLGSPSYRAYQQDSALNAYDSADGVRGKGPAWATRYDHSRASQARTAAENRAHEIGGLIVSGGGVDLR